MTGFRIRSDQGSFSNPSIPTRPKPCRRRIGGTPFSATELAGIMMPRPPNRPLEMGVPGRSAFSRYTRPPHGHGHGPATGSSTVGIGWLSSVGAGVAFLGAARFAPVESSGREVSRALMPEPPVMGIPGVSAFSPYIGPSQPREPAPGSGSNWPRIAAFDQGTRTIPVGGGGSTLGVPRIGDSNVASRRLRVGATGSSVLGEAARNAVYCSLCGEEFLTPKDLFEHARLPHTPP